MSTLEWILVAVVALLVGFAAGWMFKSSYENRSRFVAANPDSTLAWDSVSMDEEAMSKFRGKVGSD